MAKSIFDAAEIEIPCPGCGHKTKQSIGWIRTHDDFVCGGCGKTVQLDKANLLAGLGKVDKSLANLKRSLGRKR